MEPPQRVGPSGKGEDMANLKVDRSKLNSKNPESQSQVQGLASERRRFPNWEFNQAPKTKRPLISQRPKK